MNFGELQTAALHDDFDPTKYRQRCKDALNEAVGRVTRRVKMLQREAVGNVAVVAGQAAYNVPADFLRLRSLRSATLRRELVEIGVRDIDGAPAAVGVPCEFAIDGLTLMLYPTPAAAGNLTLRYWSRPALMAADGDDPGIPSDYADALVSYARSRLFRWEDDRQQADAYMGDFNAAIAEMLVDLQSPSATRRQQVRGMWQNEPSPRFIRP